MVRGMFSFYEPDYDPFLCVASHTHTYSKENERKDEFSYMFCSTGFLSQGVCLFVCLFVCL